MGSPILSILVSTIKYQLKIWKANLKFKIYFFRLIKLVAVVLLFIMTVYHMLSNKWANYINQTLAVIKLITYSIIALAGIYRLITNWDTSRINWQQPLDGKADTRSYSTSILLVKIS